MARKAAVAPPVPKAHTFTLYLKPEKAAKKAKKGETSEDGGEKDSHVKMTGSTYSFNHLRMGDVVQFIPDPKVRGASVLVEFVGKNPATMKVGKKAPTKSPFRAGKIDSSAFHTVVNEVGKFWARCFVITADGAHVGYPKDGRIGCSGPNCI